MMKASAKRLPGRNTMIDGITVRMGGRDWIVAPLTLGQLRRLWPHVQHLGESGAGMGEKEVSVVVEIVTAALQRTYPGMTPAKVEELLDLGNAGAVLNAVLTGSGLRPALGEAAALGALPAGGGPSEPNPGADAKDSNGPRSMASSLQPAGTAIPS
ncbi:MAG: hypothetical protein ACREFA_01845 [Stellaceae bacterium]